MAPGYSPVIYAGVLSSLKGPIHLGLSAPYHSLPLAALLAVVLLAVAGVCHSSLQFGFFSIQYPIMVLASFHTWAAMIVPHSLLNQVLVASACTLISLNFSVPLIWLIFTVPFHTSLWIALIAQGSV